ncbi:MAG: hypothetical protein WD768_02250 [Phycisphaeraceae bacterium]
MKIRQSFQLTACLAVAAAVAFASPPARAAAIDVKVDVPALRCIQTSAVGEGKTDEVYLLVTGIASGKAFSAQLPEGKTLKSSPKQTPIDDKTAITLWQGKLEDGQFVVVTAVLMAGTKADGKAYFEKKAAADKALGALSAKSINEDGVEKLRKDLNKASVAFFKAIDELYPKGKGDTFLGSFDVIVANVDGDVVKRIVPVGLLSGEHYGIKPKRYSKIKYTRENVLMKDASGQWYEAQMDPVSLEEDRIRVKTLEVEMIKPAGAEAEVRNVTDYLFDVRVFKGKVATKWLLNGDHPGPSIVHDYWDYAE